MKKQLVIYRSAIIFLVLALVLPNFAWALRQNQMEVQPQRAGLEQALKDQAVLAGSEPAAFSLSVAAGLEAGREITVELHPAIDGLAADLQKLIEDHYMPFAFPSEAQTEERDVRRKALFNQLRPYSNVSRKAELSFALAEAGNDTLLFPWIHAFVLLPAGVAIVTHALDPFVVALSPIEGYEIFYEKNNPAPLPVVYGAIGQTRNLVNHAYSSAGVAYIQPDHPEWASYGKDRERAWIQGHQEELSHSMDQHLSVLELSDLLRPEGTLFSYLYLAQLASEHNASEDIRFGRTGPNTISILTEIRGALRILSGPDPEWIYRKLIRRLPEKHRGPEQFAIITSDPYADRWFSTRMLADYSQELKPTISQVIEIARRTWKKEFFEEDSIEMELERDYPVSDREAGEQFVRMMDQAAAETEQLEAIGRVYSYVLDEAADRGVVQKRSNTYFAIPNTGGLYGPAGLGPAYRVLKGLLGPGQLLVDPLGGDGRIAILAALIGGQGISLELNPDIAQLANEALQFLDGVVPVENVQLLQGDMFNDVLDDFLEEADVIWLYRGSLTNFSDAVRKVKNRAKPRAWVVLFNAVEPLAGLILHPDRGLRYPKIHVYRVPAAGLEERQDTQLRATKIRIRRMVNQLLVSRETANISESQVAVIAPSYHDGEDALVPQLREWVSDLLPAKLQQEIFFDTQDNGERSNWIIDLIDNPGGLPTALFFGNEDEFRDFSSFMEPTPIGVLPFRENITDSAYLFMELLQNLGLPVDSLSFEQRRQLDQDLHLLIRA